jgi:DNA-directed RNA polymerase subunit RPC12/RpoP
MEKQKKFTKNDENFVCLFCKKTVLPLKRTSRDHCPYCLKSLHVDIFPGDRANNCKGELYPIDIEYKNQKGYVIIYKCKKCGQTHKNVVAPDDDMEQILKVMNKTYDL